MQEIKRQEADSSTGMYKYDCIRLALFFHCSLDMPCFAFLSVIRTWYYNGLVRRIAIRRFWRWERGCFFLGNLFGWLWCVIFPLRNRLWLLDESTNPAITSGSQTTAGTTEAAASGPLPEETGGLSASTIISPSGPTNIESVASSETTVPGEYSVHQQNVLIPFSSWY